MEPLPIGLTSPLSGNEEHTAAMEAVRHYHVLERAGAQPVILRNDMDPLRVIDEFNLRGIIFTGGGDICAARYGGNEELAGDRLDPQRDAFEFALIESAFHRKLPVLGICRGMQAANVVLGGTLIEDIHYHFDGIHSIPHHQIKDVGLVQAAYAHEIIIAPGTSLHELAGADRISVNSFHHQAIRTAASVLQITARADDGVVEAVEFAAGNVANDRFGFFIGVQWHPEELPEDRFSQRLYVKFLDVCKMP